MNSTDDVGTPSEPVMAVLSQDGSGTWYSLTDGWRVAASDLNGTVLSRVVGTNVEIAKVDPPQRYDFLNHTMTLHQRVGFASTLPTTLTTAEPCGATSLEVKPSADGAMGTLYGSLFVHNITTRPCEVRGPPDGRLHQGELSRLPGVTRLETSFALRDVLEEVIPQSTTRNSL